MTQAQSKPAIPDHVRKLVQTVYISPQPRLARLRSAWLRWRRRDHGRSAEPLLDAAPIHELGRAQSALEVPKPLRIAARSEKGIGDIFVGREDAMQDIEAFLNQERVKEKPFALLLTNAPGVGKSTLLDEFRYRQAEKGIAVLQMTGESFLSDAAFVEELRETELWQRSLSEEAIIWATTRAVGIAGWMAELLLRVNLLFGGVPAKPIPRFRHWYEAADRLHDLTRREPPTTVSKALRSIDRACKRGWIIAVDECGGWDQHRDNPKIKELLYEIADASARKGKRLRHGGVFLTGLPNAQEAATAVTLTRVRHLRLEPLTVLEAATLIRTALERVGSPPAITERWTETLARDFGMWTQHARRAASVASEMIDRTYGLRLSAAERESSWDYRLQLVREQTASHIMELYADITGKVVLLIGPRAVRELATANQRTEGEIPDEECTAIVSAGLARGKRIAPRTTGENAVVRELMAIGLLHRDAKLEPDHREITWSIPMGSLTSHILASTKDTDPADDGDDSGKPLRLDGNPSQMHGQADGEGMTSHSGDEQS